ncbi:hypothetical protein ACS0TY_009364 [Phlomoides rotata]
MYSFAQENADNVTHNGSERMNRLDKPRGRKQNPLRDRLDSYPRSSGQSINLVSFLHINYLNLGEVVQPHYIHLYSVFLDHQLAHQLVSFSLEEGIKKVDLNFL